MKPSHGGTSLDTRYLVRFNYDWSLSLENILDHPSAFTGFLTTETATNINIRIEWTYYFLTTRHLFYWWRSMVRGRDKEIILLMGRNWQSWWVYFYELIWWGGESESPSFDQSLRSSLNQRALTSNEDWMNSSSQRSIDHTRERVKTKINWRRLKQRKRITSKNNMAKFQTSHIHTYTYLIKSPSEDFSIS